MAAISYPLSAAEALAEERVLLNEPTASFWSDEELNNWTIVGSSVCALKGLGVIKQDTITLATDTMTYTALTTGGAGGVAKMLFVVAANYDTVYRGLRRINPISMYHKVNKTAGPPDDFWHLNTIFGVYPIPTSSENNKLVTVWYSETADDIADLPVYHQHFPIWYAVSMAYHKANLASLGSYWMNMFNEGVSTARKELYLPAPDTKEALK